MSPLLIVSIIAVIISGIAVYIGWRIQKKQIEIEKARDQERLAEKKKANLTAQIMRDERGRLVLRIENKGFGEARDIRAWLDGQPIFDHPSIVKNQKEVFIVGPQSSCQYILGISFQTPRPSGIAIAWADDSGEVSSYRNALTF